MSSEVDFNLVGTEPQSGSSFSVKFIQSSNQVTLSPNSGQTANFRIVDLPPFLRSNHGLYLGAVYAPLLKIGLNSFYYLEQTDQKSTYNLVLSYNLNCLTLSPVTPGGSDVILYNFPGVGLFHIRSTTRMPITVISPTQCPGSCKDCGMGICPENFTCVDGECATQLDLSKTAAFGLRIQTPDQAQAQVYTYSIIGNSLIVHLVPETNISAQIDNTDTNIFKERWFYADYQGQNHLEVGKRYPLYIPKDNAKYYITNPVGGPGSMVTYTLSNYPSSNVLTFAPASIANWGEFTISPTEFENFAIPNDSRMLIALWQNSSVLHTPAVIGNVRAQLGTQLRAQLGSETTTCTSNTQCTNGQVCISGTCQVCTASTQCSGGQACVTGKCQACTADTQCPAGQVCVNGTCQAPCTSTSCTGGQVCIDKKCQKCTADSQCPSGQVCQNGVCGKKPFWKTWWFWLIIAIIILLIIILIVVLLVRK